MKLLPHRGVRKPGIELNGGRVHGWMDRVSQLLDVPLPTIRSWATGPTSGSNRPINGAATRLLAVYAVMQDHELDIDGLVKLADRKLDEIIGELG